MENKQQLLNIYHNPELKAPLLIAAGAGTANVGLKTIDYLREKLGAELLAEIDPGDFFTPPYNFAFRDGLIEIAPVELGKQAPQNIFHYWKSGKDHDLIFFTGNAHPLPGKVPELASYVLDVARNFGVRRLFMSGAFLTDIHHLTEPTIYGMATDKKLLESLHSYHIAAAPPMNIAHNLNAWLVGMAKRKNIDAIGLISEIPIYNAEEANIRACRTLVIALCRMLAVAEIDLTDLNYMLIEEEVRIKQRLEELRESTDERAVEFLQYLEMLERRDERKPSNQSTHFPTQEELPDTLRYIGELYTQAKEDKSRIPQLSSELQHLDHFDRLLILRKYGDEIIKLLGWQM